MPKPITERYAKWREWHRKLRMEIIYAYGGKCQCCGESTYEFLTIDHINKGGNKHRKSRGGGSNYIREIKKLGFPKEYRVLCYNCNCSYGVNGYCPHKGK